MARRGRRPEHGFGNDAPPPTARPRRGASRYSRRPPGKVAKTVGSLCLAMVLALGIGWFVYGTVQFTYRSGLAGTPGRVFATQCDRHRSGRSSTVSCRADFLADGVSTLVPDVTVEGDTVYPALSEHPARLHADGGTASVIGLSPAAYMLGGMFFALLPVELIGGYGLMVLVRAIRRWRGRAWTPSRALLRLPMWLALGSLAVAVAAAITGAATG
jgi:hypothetical protein